MENLREARISLGAIKQNVQRIIEVSGGASLIAVVKANGYGHGAAAVAQAAHKAGATIIGVTDLGEAFQLRDDGYAGPLLSWLHGPKTVFDDALRQNIQIGVSSAAILQNVYEAAKRLGTRAVIHLKLDTGLSRGGVSREDFSEVFKSVQKMQSAGEIELRGVFSHLANTNPEEDLLQAKRFDAALELLRSFELYPPMKHLASSAAVLTSPHLIYNTVRVGLALYGLSPLDDKTPRELGLQPAMTLKSQLIATRDIEAGSGVSYSYIYRAKTAMRVGLMPFGYADGMPRLLNGEGASVVIRGTRCPIVGRIAMDQCVIDLSPLGDAAKSIEAGEEVTLFGDDAKGEPTATEWAELLGTINYEVVARLGSRIKRIVCEGDLA